MSYPQMQHASIVLYYISVLGCTMTKECEGVPYSNINESPTINLDEGDGEHQACGSGSETK